MIINAAVTEKGLLMIQQYLLSNENTLRAAEFPGVKKLRICTVENPGGRVPELSCHVRDEGIQVKPVRLIQANRFLLGVDNPKYGYEVSLEVCQDLSGQTANTCWGDGSKSLVMPNRFIAQLFTILDNARHDDVVG